jgi:hypothetical protein
MSFYRSTILLAGLLAAARVNAVVSGAEVDTLFDPPGISCAQGCAKPPCQQCVPVPRCLLDLFRWRHVGCGECGSVCEGCGRGDCGCPPCSCPQCECHPRSRKVLLKKIVTTECPTFKCEPVCYPECGGCGAECQGAVPAPEVPEEKSPPQKPTPAAAAKVPAKGRLVR